MGDFLLVFVFRLFATPFLAAHTATNPAPIATISQNAHRQLWLVSSASECNRDFVVMGYLKTQQAMKTLLPFFQTSEVAMAMSAPNPAETTSCARTLGLGRH